MNIDDPIFTDLVLKKFAGKASGEEQARLKTLLAENPALADEYKQLQADAAFAKEVLPLMGSDKIEAGPVPGYARSRLRSLMNQQAKTIERKPAKLAFSWRWAWGLATATAGVAIIVVLLNLPARQATIQFAMLDSMGQMRGTNDMNVKLMAALQENFGQTNLTACSGAQELNQWINQWPATGQVFKIVYDRDNGEVRILIRANENFKVVKNFLVAKEEDLPAVLKEASEAILQLQKSKQ